MNDTTNIGIRLYSREYQISCPQDKVEELQTSAEYLDKKMLEVRGPSASMSMDRMAVMAGLRITHELLELRDSSESSTRQQEDTVDRLLKRVEETLQRTRQADAKG